MVRWYDAASKETKETVSELIVATFPSLPDDRSLTRSQIGEMSEHHKMVVDKRVEQIRVKLEKR